jgi:Entner-Doudoroff aldolase
MDGWFDTEFAATRVMVIMRGLDGDASLALAELAWDAGVRMVEIPIQGPVAVEALGVVAAAAKERGLVVGAGTVVSTDHVDVARRAGAAYTVSPGTDEEVIRASLDAGLPTLPGVATASDVQRCVKLGLTWFKAFPAASLGPGWIAAMHGPFPDARFVATGGVTVSNAGAFLDAGAHAVSLGSALSDPAQRHALAALTHP